MMKISFDRSATLEPAWRIKMLSAEERKFPTFIIPKLTDKIEWHVVVIFVKPDVSVQIKRQ